MKRDRLKNVILTLLILNCLYLTGQICFNDNIWPGNKQFFASVRANFAARFLQPLGLWEPSDLYGNVVQAAAMPERFLLVSGNSRKIFTTDTEPYRELTDFSLRTFQLAFESSAENSVTEITKTEWEDTILGKCIFAEYALPFRTEWLGRALAAKQDNLSSQAAYVNRFAISASTISNKTQLTLCADDRYFRVSVDLPAEETTEMISALLTEQSGWYAFSFEMGYDKNDEDLQIQKPILLDSMLLLPLEKEQLGTVEIRSALPTEETDELAEEFAACFGYPASYLRKSVLPDGTVTFIETDATIQLSPDGLLSFTAAKDGYQAGSSVYEAISNLLLLIRNIQERIPDYNPPLCRLQTLEEKENGEIHIQFSYHCGGYPILEEDGGYSIRAVYKSGMVTSFRMRLLTAEETEETAELPLVLDALDRIFAAAGISEQITITRLSPVYPYREGTCPAAWNALVESPSTSPKYVLAE